MKVTMKNYLQMQGLMAMVASGFTRIEPHAYGPRALNTKKGKINAKIRARRRQS